MTVSEGHVQVVDATPIWFGGLREKERRSVAARATFSYLRGLGIQRHNLRFLTQLRLQRKIPEGMTDWSALDFVLSTVGPPDPEIARAALAELQDFREAAAEYLGPEKPWRGDALTTLTLLLLVGALIVVVGFMSDAVQRALGLAMALALVLASAGQVLVSFASSRASEHHTDEVRSREAAESTLHNMLTS